MYMKMQIPQTAISVLIKKNIVCLPDLKICYKTAIIKTAWHWYEDKSVKQNYMHTVWTIDFNQTQERKDIFSTNVASTVNMYSGGRRNLKCYFTWYTKFYLKWVKSMQKICKKNLIFLKIKTLHSERHCYKNVKSRHRREYLQNMYYSGNSYPKSIFRKGSCNNNNYTTTHFLKWAIWEDIYQGK